jgi:hypothetical protein
MATKAFLVGIDDYAPCGPGGQDLHGCVNDVKDMANTLVILGFNPRDIKILTSCNATKANIIAGLNLLLSGTAKGDSIVFYYSGHGSQIADVSGDEKTDGKDEMLCPHDTNFQKQVYILDDELRAIFSKLPAGVNLEVILDSCFSGTATRIWTPAAQFGEYAAVRYMAPPLDVTFHLDYIKDLPSRKFLKGTSKNAVLVPGLNHTLWAACSDKQTSSEILINGIPRGVFTYYFCQILKKCNGKKTRKEIDRLLTAALAKYDQTPQLETSAPEMLQKPFT